ncbi:hypothetical protein [Microvirga solisilvae]|uniref:hypothetical protein n=1 Tax=Microvirga solisilvae TaxID=2919498 RepID=UPI001FAF293E|nr:hypothetical protein [Microvirga solisilvae]
MVTALGGFSGRLDDKLQLKDALVHVPTSKAGLTARNLRMKVLGAAGRAREGHVSAVIQGANGALARSIYPQYEAYWNLRKVPAIPLKMDEGQVKDAPFWPGACLPEIQHCKDGTSAKPIPLDQPVKSVGFIVHLSLTFPGLKAGMRVRGVVALSD